MPKKQLKSNPEKRALTPEQRVFCRLVAIEKMKPSQAYMQVFKCKPNSASTMAGVFLKRIEIQEEINRLSMPIQQVQEKAHIWTKAERMERLQEWAEQSASVGKVNDAARCVDIINKMDGAYEVKPSEQNKPSEVVETVDEKELRQLAEMSAELMAQVESEEYEQARDSY
jgi:hypothetical protein